MERIARLFLINVVLAGVAFAALMGAGALSGPTAHAAGPCDVAAYDLDDEELAFLDLLNDYRAAHGLGSLRISATLTRASAWMATDMATKGYFAHTDSAGRQPSRRAADCGYIDPMGENLAAGTNWDTAKEAFEAWKNSPSHNENMLSNLYVQVGIARHFEPGSPYGWYWATDFGVVDDGTTLGGKEPASLAASSRRSGDAGPFWVNDLKYGSAAGGFYWDPRSNQVWTAERGWHVFGPQPLRGATPLWVNDLTYGSAAGGFYLDPLSGQVWTAERGWHRYA